ncbi:MULTISPECIES: ferredoxin [Nocardia]|uniref:ferredoxin n=1 Tax=Nocardia TaxID=1817 RepID=UPI002E163B40|nr:ferredoxin [Nocardia vinacea]
MKIELDRTKCTGLGICESFAPTVFEVNDEGELVLLSDTVPDGLLDDVKKACEGCPTEALTLVEE